MKYIFILCAFMLVMSSCTTQYQATDIDDVYYSPKNQPQAVKHTMVVKTPESNENSYNNNEQNQPLVYSDSDTIYVEDQQYASGDVGYNSDDYYDYAYSARIRRFYDPYSYNSYYSDFYTNAYWYDTNPWNYGYSIYMGYNWWGAGFGFGYDPWYSYPYYGFGYPYYGYGYSNYGYGHGYYDYYNPCYYNSYDKNSFYYGHRSSVGSSGSVARATSKPNEKTFGERYEASVNGGRNSARNSSLNSARDSKSSVTAPNRAGTTADGSRSSLTRGTSVPQDSRNGETRTSTMPNGRIQSTDTRANTNNANPANIANQRSGTTTQSPTTGSTRPQRQYQYVAPNRSNQNSNSQNRTNTNANSGRNTQSYTSPEYNRPRSGQEYTSPKYRSYQPSGNEQNSNSRVTTPGNTNSNSNSGSNNRTYSQPSNNRPTRLQTNERTYSPQNNSNSQPARSNTYSAPQRSSSPAPSRSSDSYSPSRSSSPGSGGSSSPSRSSSSGSSGSSSPSRSSSSGSSGGSSSGHRK